MTELGKKMPRFHVGRNTNKGRRGFEIRGHIRKKSIAYFLLLFDDTDFTWF